MNPLKLVGRTVVRLVETAWRLPRYIAAVFRERQQQIVRHELEAERLDRIRNPSKYLGHLKTTGPLRRRRRSIGKLAFLAGCC